MYRCMMPVPILKIVSNLKVFHTSFLFLTSVAAGGGRGGGGGGGGGAYAPGPVAGRVGGPSGCNLKKNSNDNPRAATA